MFVDTKLVALKQKSKLVSGDLVLSAHQGVLLIVGVVDGKKAGVRLDGAKPRYALQALSGSADDEFNVVGSELTSRHVTLRGLPVDLDSPYELDTNPQPVALRPDGWVVLLRKNLGNGSFAAVNVMTGAWDDVPYWTGQMYPSWQIEIRELASESLILQWSGGARPRVGWL